MNRTPMIDSRALLELSADFYPSVATIESLTTTRDTLNERVTWTDTAAEGATADTIAAGGAPTLRCRIAPVKADERQGAEEGFNRTTHRIAFPGPLALDPADRRIVVDGATYDVLGVQTDSEGLATYLDVEAVTP